MLERKSSVITHQSKGMTVKATSRRTFGTLKTLKSGKIQAVYRHTREEINNKDGKKHNVSERYYSHAFDNRTDAEHYLIKIEASMLDGTWRPPATIEADNFKSYADAWVKQRVTRHNEPLRPSTKALYRRQLAAGLSEFDRMTVKDISRSLVRKWNAKRREQAGETTAGSEARLLHSILQTAVEDDILDRNPVPSELLHTLTKNSHRIPTDEELANIIAALPDKWRLCAYVAAFGGLRFGEWVRLERQDLDEVDGHVVVHVTCQAQRVGGEWLIRPPKSSEGVRSISLPLWLTDIVNDHLKRFVGPFPASLIFAPDKNGTRYVSESTWSHIWRRALHTAGITDTIRSHDLRHYFGSTLAGSGVGIRQLQNALGHGTARASLGYLEAAHGLSAELADRMQAPHSESGPRIVELRSGVAK
jgi:integrase